MNSILFSWPAAFTASGYNCVTGTINLAHYTFFLWKGVFHLNYLNSTLFLLMMFCILYSTLLFKSFIWQNKDLFQAINSHHCKQVSITYLCTLCWPHDKSLHTYTIYVAGGHGRWESVAEEMDDLLESSAFVLFVWWWFPLQHNPRHVCANSQPRGLEEHCVLRSLHISVVSGSPN